MTSLDKTTQTLLMESLYAAVLGKTQKDPVTEFQRVMQVVQAARLTSKEMEKLCSTTVSALSADLAEAEFIRTKRLIGRPMCRYRQQMVAAINSAIMKSIFLAAIAEAYPKTTERGWLNMESHEAKLLDTALEETGAMTALSSLCSKLEKSFLILPGTLRITQG